MKLVAEAQDQKEIEEHWRLLYVAMTRAEEHLFIGGALKPKQQGKELSERCWHLRVERALRQVRSVETEQGALVLDFKDEPKPSKQSDAIIESWAGPIPDWAAHTANEEVKPPRPLSPSRIEVADDEPNPPPTDFLRRAAVRGIRLHSLFERLPAVPPALRAQAADLWLQGSAGETDFAVRQEIVKTALSIIEQPDFADVFSPEALAEAPIAGLVDDRVVAGTVDRLLITDEEVHVIDFKTGRRTPSSADAVSRHYKAQMGAYAALLANIFPGKTVRASLLYTHGPVLIELPAEILSAYKPGFSDPQQELTDSG